MTVEDRDQRESLLADWAAASKISRRDGEAGKGPFKAVPHIGQDALLEAASLRLLRVTACEDHACRTGAQAALEA